ncbi:MAG: hypothetical protein J6Z11_10915, partial [Candidatus Riflebacteria bacterium]|nr:hypothetical protein [Candidatus Riflebacteria bacterium]
FISMVKSTAVVGYVSCIDLTKASDIIRSRTMEAFFPLIATAIIYFMIANLMIQVLNQFEISIDPKKRNRKLVGVKVNQLNEGKQPSDKEHSTDKKQLSVEQKPSNNEQPINKNQITEKEQTTNEISSLKDKEQSIDEKQSSKNKEQLVDEKQSANEKLLPDKKQKTSKKHSSKKKKSSKKGRRA